MPSGIASTGSVLEISNVGPADPELQADWDALPWAGWDEATSIGDTGPTGSEQTYTPVKDGNVVKIATSVDNGQVDAEGPYVRTDPAIVLLRAATNTRPISPVWCRLTDPDGEIECFKANPNTMKKKYGTADSILMVTAQLSISGAIYRF